MGKKSTKKKRRVRISTTIMILVLMGAILTSGFSYYDLFQRKIEVPSAVSKEDEEKEDPERKNSQRVLPEETSIKVVNDDTAWEALDELKSKYGIRDVKYEYDLISSSESDMSKVYWYQQKYNGLEVFGHQLKLITDTDGTVRNMNGHYVDLHGMDTSLVLKEEEASDYALRYMAKTYNRSTDDFSISKSEKGIYVPDDVDEAQSCYRFRVGGTDVEKILYISGKDGTVLLDKKIFLENVERRVLQGQLGKKLLTSFKNDGNNYQLYDLDNNIYVINAEILRQTEELENLDLTGESHIYVPNAHDSQSGVDALANIEAATKYYKSELNRNGISGQGYPLIVGINDVQQKGNAAYYPVDHAIQRPVIMIGIPDDGETVDLAAYVDIMGHEFTHGVIDWTCQLGDSTSDDSVQDAMNEGLADVFGELIQAFADDENVNTGTGEWGNLNRDIAHALSPERGTNLVTLASEYTGENAECHRGSAIISYPAYLMTKQINNRMIGKLYYETIGKLESLSTFKDFRSQFDYILVNQNNNGILTDAQLECAIDAIDMSGIEPDNCKYKVEKGGQLEILDKYGEPYDDYYITIRKQNEGKVMVDRKTSGGAFYTLPSNVVTGYYDVTLEDKNKPHAKVSFVMLVNDNSSEASGRIKPYNSLQEIKTPFNSQVQEIVFVLDTSGSMSGDPLESTKTASMDCVTNILRSEPASRISVVEYSDSAGTLIRSSNNLQHLLNSIDGLSSGGGTNTYAALESAGSILNAKDKKDAKKKIIVLLSDGQPNQGPSENGNYHIPIVELTNELKEDGILFYTVGSFSSMSSEESVQAEDLMRDIASPGYDYNIEGDEIEDVFQDISKVVNGTTYQSLRIACPVDVKITSGGETLSSAEEDLNKRTSFGYLSFEGEDEDPTKIVRLENDGTSYDICITGTGEGTMDYSISYPDENGEYKDVRTFTKVPVKEGTFITTSTGQSLSTTLQVDSDGNGSVDQTYRALANRKGYTGFGYFKKYGMMIAGIAILIFGIIKGIIASKRMKRNSMCENCGHKIKAKSEFCPQCGQAHQYVNPFFIRKEPLPKQKKGIFIFKMVVTGICVFIMLIIPVIKHSAPFSAYHQIQEHNLSSAEIMYQNGVEDSKINKKILQLLLDSYMKRVEKERVKGNVNDNYYAELKDTVSDMGYQIKEE